VTTAAVAVQPAMSKTSSLGDRLRFMGYEQLGQRGLLLCNNHIFYKQRALL